MDGVWLGLGSNLGNSRQILQDAWETLGHNPAVSLITLSSPYGSDPVGMESNNRFLNAAGIIETELEPRALLSLLQEVEKGFGRNKKTGSTGYQDRLLDLDILYFNDMCSSTEELQIPHPQIANRLFVLAPLVEIDPLKSDPSTQKTVLNMYNELIQNIKNGEMGPQEIKKELWKCNYSAYPQETSSKLEM